MIIYGLIVTYFLVKEIISLYLTFDFQQKQKKVFFIKKKRKKRLYMATL